MLEEATQLFEKDEEKELLIQQLEYLAEAFAAERVQIAPHLFEETKRSLIAVRKRGDGRPNPDTADSRVRALARAVWGLHNRQSIKSVASLHDLQAKYFEIISINFNVLYNAYKGSGASSIRHWVDFAATQNDLKTEFAKVIPEFLSHLREFWKIASPVCEVHIQDLSGLKTSFGGDLFPSSDNNIVSVSGLYVDHVVLPCPFMQTGEQYLITDGDFGFKRFLGHIISILNYKDYAVKNPLLPLAIVLPTKFFDVDENYQKMISSLGGIAASKLASDLFDSDFSSVEDLHSFIDGLDTDTLIKAIKRPDLLIVEEGIDGNVEEKVSFLINEFGEKLGIDSPQKAIFSQIVGRMYQASDVLMKSQSLGATPLIEAPVSWHYFNQYLRYNPFAKTHDSGSLEGHVTVGLNSAIKKDFKWLGNLPPDVLLEVRAHDEFKELRDQLAKGVEEIIKISPDDFNASTDRVFNNIQSMFEKHEAEVLKLKKDRTKIYTADVGPALVLGAFGITASLTSIPALGLPAGLSAMFAAWGVGKAVADVYGVTPIRASIDDLKANSSEQSQLSRTPTGLLFSVKKD